MVIRYIANYNKLSQIYRTIKSSNLFVQFALLARSPDDPQRIRVASVFELSACSLSACLFVLCRQIF